MGCLRPSVDLNEEYYFRVESEIALNHEFYNYLKPIFLLFVYHIQSKFAVLFPFTNKLHCGTILLYIINYWRCIMARGKKNLSLEEQLANITVEIESMETSLSKLKETKTELEKQIKQNRLAEIDELITASGMSIEEVKVLLSK